MLSKNLVLVMLSSALIPFSSAVLGQDFPARPVRILVSSPGGTSDIVGRAMAPVLTQRFGQPVIIENSPARSDVIVANATPDGQTVLIDGGNFWTQHLIEKTPYDFIKDFAPVTLSTTSSSILVVHPSVPASNVRELIAYAKANPGKLNYGSSGVGSGAHVNAERFKQLAGVDIVHIPYKGSAEANADLIGGRIHVAFLAGNQAMNFVRSGKLKALGVASLARTQLVPDDLPLLSESGLPGFETINRTGVFVPIKTPVARINVLNREIRYALGVPDVAKIILAGGYEPRGSTPEELAALIKGDIDMTAKVVKSLGIERRDNQ